jgi:hypothetical protein
VKALLLIGLQQIADEADLRMPVPDEVRHGERDTRHVVGGDLGYEQVGGVVADQDHRLPQAAKSLDVVVRDGAEEGQVAGDVIFTGVLGASRRAEAVGVLPAGVGCLDRDHPVAGGRSCFGDATQDGAEIIATNERRQDTDRPLVGVHWASPT